MDGMPYTVLHYITDTGACPFEDWLESLDVRIRHAVDARHARVSRGLFGDCAPIGAGIFKLRINTGPGYRIYFARQGSDIVILLHAGDKHRQWADIGRAKAYWHDHLRRMQG